MMPAKKVNPFTLTDRAGDAMIELINCTPNEIGAGDKPLHHSAAVHADTLKVLNTLDRLRKTLNRYDFSV